MTLLAIETSCDDTAAAVFSDGRVLSSLVSSQEEHIAYGGVVPEIAGRAHERFILPVVEASLSRAGKTLDDIEAVAVTYGPGLAGSLHVGISFAKALAFGRGVPLVGVNHLQGHIYSVFARAPEDDRPIPDFPFLCLTVSGGHTQLVLVEEGFKHTLLGGTRDDAAGEAFDKVGKMLGLPFPGGPEIDRLAREGDPNYLKLPTPRLSEEKTGEAFAFSFSGLKTAVRYYLDDLDGTAREDALGARLPDLCASFQSTVVVALLGAVAEAVQRTGVRRVAIVGGVSANSLLRSKAAESAKVNGFELFIPPPGYSVDNAAMIAVTGAFRLEAGESSPLTLSAEPALRL